MLIKLQGRALYALLRSGEHVLQTVLDCTHVALHLTVARTDHVGHPVINPEAGIPRESHTVAVAFGIRIRHFVSLTIHRGEHRHVGIVKTEPQHAAHHIGHAGTHLRDKHEAALLSGDGTFIKILLTVHIERQRRQAIRRSKTAGSEILGDVKWSTFVMVAHSMLDVAHRHLAVGLHIQGHGVLALSLYVRKICLSRSLAEHVIETPHTSLTGTKAAEIEGTIGIGKTEVLVPAAEIAFLTGERDDIRRIQAVVLVVEREPMDAALVGVSGDTVIGDTYGHPYGTLHAGAFTDHLHNPRLIWIGNRERLAAAVVSVFLHQVSHHLDGFLGTARTLQGNINQASVIHYPGRVHQFRTPAESGLADGHLKLVDVSDYVISLLRLSDPAEILAGIPLIDVAHGPFGMHGRRIMTKEAEHPVRISRIRHDYRTVSRCVFTHNEIGASPSACHTRHKQHSRGEHFSHSHFFFTFYNIKQQLIPAHIPPCAQGAGKRDDASHLPHHSVPAYDSVQR